MGLESGRKRGIGKRKRNELRAGSEIWNENEDMKQREERKKRKFNVGNYTMWGQKVEEKGNWKKEEELTEGGE